MAKRNQFNAPNIGRRIRHASLRRMSVSGNMDVTGSVRISGAMAHTGTFDISSTTSSVGMSMYLQNPGARLRLRIHEYNINLYEMGGGGGTNDGHDFVCISGAFPSASIPLAVGINFGQPLQPNPTGSNNANVRSIGYAQNDWNVNHGGGTWPSAHWHETNFGAGTVVNPTLKYARNYFMTGANGHLGTRIGATGSDAGIFFPAQGGGIWQTGSNDGQSWARHTVTAFSSSADLIISFESSSATGTFACAVYYMSATMPLSASRSASAWYGV